MNCETVCAALVALLDGELHGEERRAIDAHVSACPSCQQELVGLKATRVLVTRELTGLVARASGGSFEELWKRVLPTEEGASRSRAAGLLRKASRSAVRGGEWRAVGRRASAWLGVGGLAAAAGLALAVVGLQNSPQPAPEASRSSVAAQPSRPRSAEANAEKAPVPAKLAARHPNSRKERPVARSVATSENQAKEEGSNGGDTEVAKAGHETDPPNELLDRPELFLDYPIVRKLDELRNLDAVLAESPAEGGAG